VGKLSVRGLLRELEQGLVLWTIDALRIGKVFVQYRSNASSSSLSKSIPQVQFEHGVPDCHVARSRIPRSMIGVDESLGRIQHRRTPLKISSQGETHFHFAAMYR
jgi:hypothetical protein